MYWVDDPEFDIEQHLHHVALPKPGDRRELQKMLARLTADLMDMSRPPWDAYVIEGLDNVSGVPQGSIGLLLRIHHAAIDGHSGHALLQALHDPALTGDYGNRQDFHCFRRHGVGVDVAADLEVAPRWLLNG